MTGHRDEAATELARGLSFGSVANQYERYRLDYPDELVDAVVQYAGGPLRSALEVGAGTGKATRLFASRKHRGGRARTRRGDGPRARAKNFRTARRFDMVYAAAAWHWTDPACRWTHAAEMLAPGGVLALFGRPAELQDPALSAAVDEIEKQVLPDDSAVIYPWSVEEMTAADGLIDVVQIDLPSAVTTTAADFVGRLATVSAYLMLSTRARTDTLHRVRALLPDRVDIDGTVQLSLARRA